MGRKRIIRVHANVRMKLCTANLLTKTWKLHKNRTLEESNSYHEVEVNKKNSKANVTLKFHFILF